MSYGRVAGLDKPVSRLVQGAIMINSKDLDGSFRLLDEVYALGCNAFDTAHIYGGGDSERTLGRWVRERGLREKVVLITKGAHLNVDRARVTPFDIAADLHDSLARFQSDYIDLYLLHRDDPRVPVGPIVEALNEHLRAGRIRAFGGSNWTHERIGEANAYAAARGLVGFAVTSPQLSLAEMVEPLWLGCVGLGGPSGRAGREWYARHRVPVFAWSSLGRGFLSGRFRRGEPGPAAGPEDEAILRSFGSADNFTRLERAQTLAAEKGVKLPQIALAYVLSLPLEVFPLTGCLSGAEFQENLAALTLRLTPREIAWLDLESDER